MISSSEIDGWILAGGESRRMGVDKASLDLGGRTLIEIAANLLLNICEGRVSIAGQPREFILDWPAFPDGHAAGLGPLSGLSTAIENGKSAWIAILSCDMPFISSEVFARLADHAADDIDAVIPVQGDQRPQPLGALYRRSAVRKIAKDLIQSSDRSMDSLLSRLRVRYIPFSAFSDLPNADHLFLNINSPADHTLAKEIFLFAGG